MQKKFYRIFATFLLSIISLSLIPKTFASSEHHYSFATAYLPISTANVREGSLISFSHGAYILSSVPGDESMVGVITDSPAISQKMSGPTPSYPVITEGQGLILVSTINGAIKKGDFLTSSSIPGVAMKATDSGYIIGAALEDYTDKNTTHTKKIKINLHLRYLSKSNNFSFFPQVFASNQEINTTSIFQYIVAAGIILTTLGFATLLVTRTANKSIEEIGRNPLSHTTIQLSMLMVILVAIGIITSGFAMSIFMLHM